MLITVHRIVTIIIIVLGVVHIGFTYHDYNRFTMGAVWFIGTGVAIILAGFLNITLRRDVCRDRLVRWLCHGTNIVFTLGFAGAILMLPQPPDELDAGVNKASHPMGALVNSQQACFVILLVTNICRL